MAIKELVYATKQQLEFATQRSFRHSHVYELFAAELLSNLVYDHQAAFLSD